MIANFSYQTLTLPKHTVLRKAEEVSESVIDQINQNSPAKQTRKLKNKALYDKLLRGKLDHLSLEEKNTACTAKLLSRVP